MNMDSSCKLKINNCVFLKHVSNPECDSPKDDGNNMGNSNRLKCDKCKSEEQELKVTDKREVREEEGREH